MRNSTSIQRDPLIERAVRHLRRPPERAIPDARADRKRLLVCAMAITAVLITMDLLMCQDRVDLPQCVALLPETMNVEGDDVPGSQGTFSNGPVIVHNSAWERTHELNTIRHEQ